MKITESNVSMMGQQQYVKKYTREEELKIRIDPTVAETRGQRARLGTNIDLLEISDKSKEMLIKENEVEGINGEIAISGEEKQKMLMLQLLLEALTGKKIRFQVLEKLPACSQDAPAVASSPEAKNHQPQRQGWGMEYYCRESLSEQEKLVFSAEGIIKTADGQEISFSASLSLSREFVHQQQISILAGDARIVDPLVINYEGRAAELADRTFEFDLDCDGQADQVSALAPGSGFLALDLDGDGSITSGKEIFGPQTGNGFTELAQYDQDNNGWIDENDAIFDRLRIWRKDSEGKETLFTLGQKGIGAIYLGNLETPFTYKDGNNETQGQLVRTGIFLKETGQAGTVEQIDLKI
ncbi:MAG: hypothetical protein ACOX4L_00410 [Bacillota bacterium]|jgi:hypothetical protein